MYCKRVGVGVVVVVVVVVVVLKAIANIMCINMGLFWKQVRTCPRRLTLAVRPTWKTSMT